MHCDFLNITVPLDDADTALKGLLPIFGYLGLTGNNYGSKLLYRSENGGALTLEDKKAFWLYSASGQILSLLRATDMLDQYLGVFAGVRHRVSLMHVAHDVPVAAPRRLAALYARAHSEQGLKLTRKRLQPHQVRKIMRRDADGNDTGTVYLGSPKAEVRAKVYDKRFERISKAGYDPAPLTRYELEATAKVGVSLRDVSDPEPLFWHYMQDVMQRPRPDNVSAWAKGESGYTLPPKVSLLPAEIIKRGIERSTDFDQWVALADSMGIHGRDYLRRLLLARVDDGQADFTPINNAESDQSE